MVVKKLLFFLRFYSRQTIQFIEDRKLIIKSPSIA